jgi:hypothetical protein
LQTSNCIDTVLKRVLTPTMDIFGMKLAFLEAEKNKSKEREEEYKTTLNAQKQLNTYGFVNLKNANLVFDQLLEDGKIAYKDEEPFQYTFYFQNGGKHLVEDLFNTIRNFTFPETEEDKLISGCVKGSVFVASRNLGPCIFTYPKEIQDDIIVKYSHLFFYLYEEIEKEQEDKTNSALKLSTSTTTYMDMFNELLDKFEVLMENGRRENVQSLPFVLHEDARY